MYSIHTCNLISFPQMHLKFKLKFPHNMSFVSLTHI